MMRVSHPWWYLKKIEWYSDEKESSGEKTQKKKITSVGCSNKFSPHVYYFAGLALGCGLGLLIMERLNFKYVKKIAKFYFYGGLYLRNQVGYGPIDQFIHKMREINQKFLILYHRITLITLITLIALIYLIVIALITWTN